MKSPLSIVAACVGVFLCGSRAGQATEPYSLAKCAEPEIAIHGSSGRFIWKQALLQLSAANHAGALVLFDGKALKVFRPNEYGAPETIPVERPPIALAISESGAIAWLASISDQQNASLIVHLLRKGVQTKSTAFQRQQWKVPQTWPELYFVGELPTISEQHGKLSQFDDSKESQLKVVVPPNNDTDFTGLTQRGELIRYVWRTRTPSGVSSSVVIYHDLESLRANRAAQTAIKDPIYGWVVTVGRIVFLTKPVVGSKYKTWVHFVRQDSGLGVGHLDYSSQYCWVNSLDAENGRLETLLNDGLIQIVDPIGAHILDQIALPSEVEYRAADQITAIGKERFLVRTASGIALIDEHQRI